MKKILSVVALGAAMLAISCGSNDIEVDGLTGTVKEVKDGNTVVLNNGLTVHLLGLNESSSFNEQYLQNNVLNKKIELKPDSRRKKDHYIKNYKTEVWAYAKLKNNKAPVNRNLLTLGGEASFSKKFLKDSLSAYTRIVKDDSIRRPLTDVELSALLKASSFLIEGYEPGEGSFIGTGFFINENGLAISNSHVVHKGAAYQVRLSDVDGNLGENGYKIKTIYYAGDHENTTEDFAIFYVDLDDDTKAKQKYLTVAKDKVVSGDKAATVGNPSPDHQNILPMRYAYGTISSLPPEMDRLGINVPIQGGFSGGPLVNQYGQVIGISSSGWAGSDANLNYAMDIQTVRKKLDELNLPFSGK